MVYGLEINETTFPTARFANISSLLNIALPLVLAGAALTFLMMSLMSAFNILTHGDNPDVLKKAYASLVFAVVGLIIVIASFVVVRVIGGLIGAQLLPQ